MERYTVCSRRSREKTMAAAVTSPGWLANIPHRGAAGESVKESGEMWEVEEGRDAEALEA